MSRALFFLSLLPTIFSSLIPVPLEEPHPINSHELVCHYGLPIGHQTFGTKYKISILTPSQTSHEVEGYLCSKTIWETSCNEGFFGGQSISYTIHKTAITEGECLQAYKTLKEEADNPIPHFPPNYCSWMALNTKSETFVTMKKHNVYWDPYRNSYEDLVFLNHRCSDLICKTHYDNVKWITGSSNPKICTKWLRMDGDLVVDLNNNPEWSYVEAEFIPRTPISQICFGVKYCGLIGYSLPNGLFFSLASNDESRFNLKGTYRLKDCSVTREVSLLPLSSSLATVELQTLEILFNTKCNDVVSKIKEGKNVTVYELGFLNPTYPGIGYSFLSIQNKLYSLKTRFEPANNPTILFSETPIIRYITKENLYQSIKVNNCTWIKSENKTLICRWLNGLFITDKKLIYPYSTREESKDELDIYSEIQPNFDKHIGIPDLTNDTIHTSDQVTNPDYINPDLIGSMTIWATKWFHYLGLSLFIAVICLAVCCFKDCLNKYCKTYKSVSKKEKNDSRNQVMYYSKNNTVKLPIVGKITSSSDFEF